MVSLCKSCFAPWRWLLLANVVSLGVQGAVFALASAAGAGPVAGLVVAKSVAWSWFLWELMR